MRLLIITQKVDPSDHVLGFFCGWLEECSRQMERVTVIAQSAKEYPCPANAQVFSLGKEHGEKNYRQVLRFWMLLIAHRHEYDAVLVHMTPIWVVMGAPLWLLLRKRMYLWYEARGTRWPLKAALRLVRKVFSASAYGMPLSTPKSVIVGHGIDTSVYVPSADARDERLFITVGRITAAKRFDLALACFTHFGEGYRFIVGGSALTEQDEQTLRELQRFMHQNRIADRVQMGFVSRFQVIGLYQTAGLFLHASVSGLDKAVLEAMACGCLTLSTSPALAGVLPDECRATDSDMYPKAVALLGLSPSKKKALRQTLRSVVEERHSLKRLVTRLAGEMSV